MRDGLRLIPALMLLSLLSACSSNDDIDPDTLPAELVDYTPALQVEELWSVDIGSISGELSGLLRPVVDAGKVYVTDYKGRVRALDAETGDSVWTTDLKIEVASATGAGDGAVLVASNEGEVIALEMSDGSLRWRHQLSSEVLAPPQAGFGTTVALALDGRVYGIDSVTGEQRWRADAVKPILTLRGNASPSIAEGVALIGHDSGKVSAYRLADGATLWNARIGVPEGNNELERMVDVDATPRYLNGLVYGLSYQGGLMAINPQTGRGNWFQPASSVYEIGLFGGTVAITEDDGRIHAFNAITGDSLWDSDLVRNRGTTGPVIGDTFVAVADNEGYVHFFRRSTGVLANRLRIGRDAVTSPLVAISDGLLVLDDGGRLTALRVSETR